jgi:hypothetical protein
MLFMSLAAELRPYIIAASQHKGIAQYIPNGRISPDVQQLACAIHWFARGSAYDVMTTYSIGHSDTIHSCRYVVDAINRHPRFDIACSVNHDKQRSIAKGFYDISSAGFGCWARAVDGILIWIQTPSQKDCTEAGATLASSSVGERRRLWPDSGHFNSIPRIDIRVSYIRRNIPIPQD